MAQLIDELFLRAFDNEWLRAGQRPGARSPCRAGRMVMATDSHVVSPLFFPGGDIGCLVGARHDQRRRDVGRDAALSRGGVHPRGRLSARRPEAHRRVDGGGVARGRRADRHRRHQGRRAGQGRRRVHHDDRRRRRSRRRRHLRRPRAPGDAILVSGTHRRPRRGDHVAAREPDVRDDDRVRHRGAARARRGDGRGGARASTACAIRRAAGSRRR